MSCEPSDVALAARVAATIAVPRVLPADSFVLHAPLELLARTALLPLVSPSRRDEARQRISDIARQYSAFGPGVEAPHPRDFDSVAAAGRRLVEEIGAGDSDGADATAAWLGERVRPFELGPLLGDALAPLLAAAGHAPIFLAQWPRICPRRELSGTLLRPLVRALCSQPSWRIDWIDSMPSTPAIGSVFDVLATTPLEGPAESDFIHPTMKRVDHERTAARVGPVVADAADLSAAGRDVLRVAAWTMLAEPGAAAPYLWSHCLTMPQAVLALAPGSADPCRLLAIAATHVTGFRSAHARAALPIDPTPRFPCALALGDAIDGGQETAAATAWHTPAVTRPALVTELVDRAATHEDAHLVKYTLACLDAATDDPEMAHLFLAAAASLSGWWATATRP